MSTWQNSKFSSFKSYLIDNTIIQLVNDKSWVIINKIEVENL